MTRTGTKATTTAAALAAATARLDACTQALAAAQEQHDDLTARLARGDDSVTALDLMTADAERQRAGVLLTTAEAHRAEADQAHRTHVATTTAQRLTTSAVLDDLDTKVDATVGTIRAALADLRHLVEQRNASVIAATQEAQDAGLIAGECDPLSPVIVRPASWASPRTLVVNGTPVPLTDADALADRALALAQA